MAQICPDAEGQQASLGEMRFRVSGQPAARDVPRIGVNLGSQTSWGAEQLMSNVLANPGFESTRDGAIVVVREVSGSEFTDDTTWLARPAGFWKGARFSVRTGRMAGSEGRILGSDLWKGYPHLRADRYLAGLAAGDVVALTRESATGQPSHWWWQNPDRIHADPEGRPGSEGRQSLVMTPDRGIPPAAISYVDQIGDRAGKLLPLKGTWEVSFWAKSIAGGSLTVQLRRENSSPFLHETVLPSVHWKQYRFRFQPHDLASPAGLEFKLEASGAGSEVSIDDVSLAEAEPSVSGFRPAVVETLRQLRPGYLRDWQGQLGDSFANRLASPEARRPFRYRPGDETAYGYSLPEFLELCHQVDARPWIVLPTTMNDGEWSEAGAWLKAQQARYGFREIVVEFGNENWNAIFRPAGILDAARMEDAAERGFHLLNQAAGNDPRILPALGGKFVDPASLAEAARRAPDARLLAVAPYYARSLHKAEADGPRPGQLFATEDRPMDDYARLARQSGRQVAIYEMNAHSLDGDASPEEASALVSSAASGSAILFHALRAMEAGVSRQCFFTLASFDTFRGDRMLVRLFGITRDLSAPGRLRPTGLAMELGNRVIAGDAYDVFPSGQAMGQPGPAVALRAFHSERGWSILAASASAQPVDLVVEFPAGQTGLPKSILWLAAPSPMAGNEAEPQVSLRGEPAATDGNRLRLHLEPFGAAVAYSEPAGVPLRNSTPEKRTRPSSQQWR